ncbi:MAG: prolipoprotein diacylglyceryl transferase [Gaiellales bacterium]
MVADRWQLVYKSKVEAARPCVERAAPACTLRIVHLLAIPSPGDPFLINTGPIHARWYGLLLAVGVLLAGWIARREFRRRGFDPEAAYSIAVWGVPAGLIGARLYHVITDWGAFSGHYLLIPQIQRGGLSIFGAVVGGMLGVWIGCRRTRLPFWEVADCIAPGLILAQALGRWGNYFNQELYGRPSNLPWAVRIDHPPPPYAPGTTFQPTFLYESLWDVLVFFILLWFVRRNWNRVVGGTVFALYVALYNTGRTPIETLRIDTADIFLGQRVNVWVSGVLAVIGWVAFLTLMRRRRAAPAPAPHAPAPSVTTHQPTPRPTAAIAARLRTQRKKRS